MRRSMRGLNRRRLPRQEQRDVIWHQVPPILDTYASPSVGRQPKRQSGVNSQLDSCVQWQSVNDDFQAPPNVGISTRSSSMTTTLVATRPPVSRHIRATTLQKGNPFCPEPLPVRTLRGDGPKSRVDGHTGRNARLGEGCQPSARAAVGPHQSLCWVRHSMEKLRLSVGPFNT